MRQLTAPRLSRLCTCNHRPRNYASCAGLRRGAYFVLFLFSPAALAPLNSLSYRTKLPVAPYNAGLTDPLRVCVCSPPVALSGGSRRGGNFCHIHPRLCQRAFPFSRAHGTSQAGVCFACTIYHWHSMRFPRDVHPAFFFRTHLLKCCLCPRRSFPTHSRRYSRRCRLPQRKN